MTGPHLLDGGEEGSGRGVRQRREGGSQKGREGRGRWGEGGRREGVTMLPHVRHRFCVFSLNV